MPRRTKRSTWISGRKIAVSAVILLIIAGLLIYRHTRPHVTTTLKPTISSLPSSSQSSQNRSRTSSSSNGVSQGTASDNNGANLPASPSSQWTKSANGLITVKTPGYGSTVKSGDLLTGSAQENQVQFRLIDNQVGVIGQGILNVANGNFSGTLSFTSHGSSGRLDVFTLGPNGEEVNEAQVPVNF